MAHSAAIARGGRRNLYTAYYALVILAGMAVALTALRPYGAGPGLVVVASGTGIGAALAAYLGPRASQQRPFNLALFVLLAAVASAGSELTRAFAGSCLAGAGCLLLTWTLKRKLFVRRTDAKGRVVAVDLPGALARSLREAEEAVARHRLADSLDPGAAPNALAAALTTLSARLAAARLRERALSAAEDSVREYRVHVAESSAYRNELAVALTALAARHSALGRSAPALAASSEAVAAFRSLGGTSPECLAAALTQQADSSVGPRMNEEALKSAEEAVGIYRELTRAGEQVDALAFAHALRTRATRAGARYEQALADLDEAAGLASGRNLQQALSLALTLNTRSRVLRQLGRHHEAVDSSRHAIRITRALAGAWPDGLPTQLALMQFYLACALARTDRRWDALRACDKAVAAYRAKASESRLARHMLARSLFLRASLLALLRHEADSLAAVEETVAIDRALERAGAHEFDAAGFERVLRFLARRLARAGREDDARRVVEEADQIAQGRSNDPLPPE
jgi:tetratricopeptide (TPR) repeat protein